MRPNSDLKEGVVYYMGLTSATFQGNIPSSGFDVNAFSESNIRDQFYAKNPRNGTPGTYTVQMTPREEAIKALEESRFRELKADEPAIKVP